MLLWFFRLSAYIVGFVTIILIPFSLAALLQQISQRSSTRMGYAIAYTTVFYLPMTARLIRSKEDDPTVFQKKEVRDYIAVGSIGILITVLCHIANRSFEQFSSHFGVYVFVFAIVCMTVEKHLAKFRR